MKKDAIINKLGNIILTKDYIQQSSDVNNTLSTTTIFLKDVCDMSVTKNPPATLFIWLLGLFLGIPALAFILFNTTGEFEGSVAAALCICVLLCAILSCLLPSNHVINFSSASSKKIALQLSGFEDEEINAFIQSVIEEKKKF